MRVDQIMIKKIILLFCDLLIVVASFSLATLIKYGSFNHPYFAHKSLTAVLLFILLLWGVMFVLLGLYRSKKGVFVELDEIALIVLACSISTLALVLFSYFTKESIYSRTVVVYAWIFSCAFISGLHLLVQKRLAGKKRIVLIGEGRQSDAVFEKISKFPGLGYSIIGRERGSDVPELSKNLLKWSPDGAIIALPREDAAKISELIEICEESGIDVWVVPGVLELVASRIEVDDVDGIPLISLNNPSEMKLHYLFKRAFDIIVSGILLIFLSPLLLLVALMIRLSSKGPVLFVQERIGFKGRAFNFIKFRTMYDGSDKKVAELLKPSKARKVFIKMENDPRITPVGRWLRKFSIDELPQLLNVMRGDMSLVGPRPLFKEGVDNSAAWMKKRLRVLPGITGLWQVSGRSKFTDEESVMLDIYYIEHWSFWLDLKILLYTIPAVLSAKGAY